MCAVLYCVEPYYMLYCAVVLLCYNVLYCVVLCVELYCTIYCIVLYCAVLYSTVVMWLFASRL